MISPPVKLMTVMAATLAFSGLVTVAADDNSPPKSASISTSARVNINTAKQPLVYTPEREAAALSFVKRHHAELADLLNRLKQRNSEAYRQAVVELFQTSENLAHLQTKDSKRHEISLDTWKAKSRIEVLSARLAGSESSQDLTNSLKQALEAQADAEIRRQKLELEQVQARAKKLQDSIDRLERDRKSSVDSKLKKIVDRGRKARNKPKEKSASKSKGE